MMVWRRSLQVFSATFLLGACESYVGADVSYLRAALGNCGQVPVRVVESVDWDRAKRINVRIRQNEFTPMIIGMQMDRAYVLRIRNADDYLHDFNSEEFFKAVAVAKVAVGGRELSGRCIEGVSVEPRQTAEVQLVALRDGRYEFADSAGSFLFPILPSGVINIGLPHKQIVSPVKFVPKPEDFLPSLLKKPAPGAPLAPTPATAPGKAPVTPDNPFDLKTGPEPGPEPDAAPADQQAPPPVEQEPSGIPGFF